MKAETPMWPQDWIRTDETLPPDYVKILNGESAMVFRLDLETETARHVAEWPEKDERPT